MHRAIAFRRTLPKTPRSVRYLNPFTANKNEPHNPAHQRTDNIDQAKNSEGANPSAQQAKVTKQQNPAGQSQPAQTQKDIPSGGLKNSDAYQKGEKPGEEAVNPAVKGGQKSQEQA